MTTIQQVDVEALPLLLCGPILRRVSPRTVNVFVVLKAERWVQLKLYDHPNTFASDDTFVDDPIAGLTYTLESTVRLGEHFFVAMATVQLSGNDELTPGQHYWYNVFFHDASDGSGSNVSLAQTAFHLLTFDNPHRIGFAQGHLPGFVVPPSELTELNIVQGSCRKPHGGGIDMMAAIDGLLAIDGAEVAGAQRPHLLVLGGDQIYADDVSAPFLRIIHDTANALLGWEEALAGTSPQQSATDAISQGLVDLETQVEEWEIQPVSATAEAVTRIEQLADLVAGVIDHVKWSDNCFDNEIAKVALKWQMRSYEDDARDWIEEANPTIAAEPMLLSLIGGVKAWFRTYRDLFAPLSTHRSWGRIKLLQEKADKPQLLIVRSRLAAVAASSATGTVLYDELVAAFDVTVTGDDLDAWLNSSKVLVGRLAGLVDDTATIVGFVTLFRSEWFYNDPDGPVAVGDPGALDAFNYVPSRIGTPQRGLELKQHARLTSDAMASHLMFLGEFYLMYTMVWSDVLWPRMNVAGNRAYVMPEYFESVPNYALSGPLGPSGLGEANVALIGFAHGLPAVRRVLANVPTLMMFDDHEVTDDWNLNEDWVRKVNSTEAGAQVLRNALLAYAVFQDWGNQPDDYADSGIVATQPKGRRLLDEITYTPDPPPPDDSPPEPPRPPALYTIGQHGTVAQMEVDGLLGTGPTSIATLPGLTVDSLRAPFGADTSITYRIVEPAGRKQWDWAYDLEVPTGTAAPARSVRVISLDTRTHRGFPDEAWAANVGIALDTPAQFGGKIAAAALINGEELTRQLSDRFDDDVLHIVVSPAPVFGLPLVEDLIQRMQVLTSGPEVADFEAWQANPHGFGQLLTALRMQDCVLLSGDVHYAYSNLMTFPPADLALGPPLPRKLLLQLCSSSMKNETALTQLLGAIGRNGRLVDFIGPAVGEIGEMVAQAFARFVEAVGDLTIDSIIGSIGDFFEDVETWLDETAPLLNVANPEAWLTYYLKLKDSMLFSLNVQSPAGLLAVGHTVVAYIVGDLFGAEPGVAEREGFTMNFLKDVRDHEARIARAQALNGVDRDIVENGVAATERRLAEMSEVVGYNNIGLVTFSGAGTTAIDVEHELLWHPHGRDNQPLPPVPPRLDPLLVSTVHGSIPPLAELPARIAQIAQQMYDLWHPDSGEVHENEADGLRILRAWQATMSRYDDRLDDLIPSLPNFSQLTFTDADQSPWGALFISSVMHRAQVGDLWFHSPRHIDHVRSSHGNRVADNGNPFRLYDADEDDAVVRVGDVVGGHSITAGQAHAPVANGAHVGTHFDIVVAVHPPDEHLDHPHVHMIGGNVESAEPGATGEALTANNRVRRINANGKLRGDMNYLIRAEER